MKKIYIDLDGLLDTRLGTLSLNNPEAAVQVVKSDAYWDRDYTDWHRFSNGYVDNDTFNHWWVERDRRVLQESVVTGIITVLMRLLTEYSQNQKEGTVEEDVAVEINIAPYDFSDDEMDELTAILREATYSELPVLFSSRPLDELTPEFIREQYGAVILFEFHAWIRHHHTALVEHRCRDITFVVPRLFEQDPQRLSDEQRRDEFIAFRLGFLDHLELEFIDANWFSMFRPLKAQTE
jgi:hypothetical protein